MHRGQIPRLGKRQPFGIGISAVAMASGAPWERLSYAQSLDPQAVLVSRDEAGNLLGRSRRTQPTENAKPQKNGEGTSRQRAFLPSCVTRHVYYILRRLATAWQRPRSMPVPVDQPGEPHERGSYPKVARKPAVLLDAARLLGKLQFSLWPRCHNSFPPKSARSRTSRSVRPPFSTACSCAVIPADSCARHRSACGGPCQMAPRGRTRPAAS